MIETKVEEVVIPKNEARVTTETSEQPDPEYVSDEGEDLSLSGEEDIEYSDEEEYENDDDEEEEISDVDDTDLLKRLEAKYGKLPQKHSDDEEDDIDPTWTSKFRFHWSQSYYLLFRCTLLLLFY